jgi:hypothetical protein
VAGPQGRQGANGNNSTVAGPQGKQGASGSPWAGGTFTGEIQVGSGVKQSSLDTQGVLTIGQKSSTIGGKVYTNGPNANTNGSIDCIVDDHFGMGTWRGGHYGVPARFGNKLGMTVYTMGFYTGFRGHLIIEDSGGNSVILQGAPATADKDGNFIIRRPTSKTTEGVQDNLRLERFSGNLGIRGGFSQLNNFGTSDVRLKKDIVSINPSDSLSNIMKLNPVTFKWNDEEHNKNGNSIGLIAQEVEKLYPNLINEFDSWDETSGAEVRPQCELNDDEIQSLNSITEKTKYKSLSYQSLVPVLISALQEQQKQIDELKQKLN